MAIREKVGTAGYRSATDIGVMDNRTPPPADSINAMTGIEKTAYQPAPSHPFNMSFNI